MLCWCLGEMKSSLWATARLVKHLEMLMANDSDKHLLGGKVADIICNQLRQIFIHAIITSWRDYCNPLFAGLHATVLPSGICNFCRTMVPKCSSQPRFITHITGKTSWISSAAQHWLERLSAYMQNKMGTYSVIPQVQKYFGCKFQRFA